MTRAGNLYTSQRHRIEQAIARGESLDWIVEHIHVDPATVDRVLARMDAAHHGHPLEHDADEPEYDEVLVQRIMSGAPRPSRQGHTAEMREAVRRLAARGLTDSAIAYRLNTGTDGICQFRHRHGIPAGQPDTRATSASSWRTALTTRRSA